MKENIKGYQGIFFDEETTKKLIELQEDGLEEIVPNMHVTFFHGCIEKYPNDLLKKEYEVTLTGYASDGLNSGFSVEIPEEVRKYYKNSALPHITVSIGEKDGVKGKKVDTGKLDFKPLKEKATIKGKFGYFVYGQGLCMKNDIFENNSYDEK